MIWELMSNKTHLVRTLSAVIVFLGDVVALSDVVLEYIFRKWDGPIKMF